MRVIQVTDKVVIRNHGFNNTVGIDAGSTLWKLVLGTDKTKMRVVPAGDTRAVKDCLNEWNSRHVYVTGSGSTLVTNELNGISVRSVEEFRAWAHGAQLLARRSTSCLPRRFLLVSIGTGTFVLQVEAKRIRHMGGMPVGGGTAMGLARILRLAASFEGLVRLARRGERRHVDLLVRDVYPSRFSPMNPRFTASSFGKLQSRKPADLACALMGLIGETIGIHCAQIARSASICTAVFGGSTLPGNCTLQKVLRENLQSTVEHVYFLRGGAFCGAVGAAFWGQKNSVDKVGD